MVLARSLDILGGIIAYCTIVFYLTGLFPSPAFWVPFLDGLLHFLAAISILSVYPSEGVIVPLHSKYAGSYMARGLILLLVMVIAIIGPIMNILKGTVTISK